MSKHCLWLPAALACWKRQPGFVPRPSLNCKDAPCHSPTLYLQLSATTHNCSGVRHESSNLEGWRGTQHRHQSPRVWVISEIKGPPRDLARWMTEYSQEAQTVSLRVSPHLPGVVVSMRCTFETKKRCSDQQQAQQTYYVSVEGHSIIGTRR
jgi:hypothetical protein